MSAAAGTIGALNAKLTADSSQFDAAWQRVLANLKQTGAATEQAQAKIAQLGATLDASAAKHEAYVARMQRAFQREAQQAQPLRELIRVQAEQGRTAELAALKADILARSEGALGAAWGGAASEGLRLQNAIGLVDNTMRGQFSRSLADMVRGVSNFGFVMKLLPIAATAAGIVVLAELAKEAAQKFEEWRQREERLATTMRDLQSSLAGVTEGFRNSFLEAEIEADDLNNNHLKALQERLELINNQSMANLIESLNEVAAAADKAFGTKNSGAKGAFDDFKSRYTALIRSGDQKGAAALLSGTLAQARLVLKLQQSAATTPQSIYGAGAFGAAQSNPAFTRLVDRLATFGAGFSGADITRQKALVQALQDQATNASLAAKTTGVKRSSAMIRSEPAPVSLAASVDERIRQLVGTHASSVFRMSPEDAARYRESQRLAAEGAPRGADVVAEMNADINRTGPRWNEYWRTLDRAAVDSARLQEQMAEIQIRAQAAAGGFTKMQEQMALASARAAEFKVEMGALEEERARIQGDQTLTAPEKATQLAQVNGQMQQLAGQNRLAALQYALDARMTSPMQEFARSVRELEQRFTDLGAAMGGEFLRDLQSFNQTLVMTLTTPAWQRQGRNVWGQMGAGVFRGIASSALQYGEGQILKLFGLDRHKPTGRAGDPLHTVVDAAPGGGVTAGLKGLIGGAAGLVGGAGGGAGGLLSSIGGILGGAFGLPGFEIGRAHV